MLDRDGVKNRINGLVKEYESDGLGTDIGDAMAEILKAIKYHNMRKLTYEELLKCHGIPVWLESTKEWLKVDDECRNVGNWIIPRVYSGILADCGLPWLWEEEGSYGKWWNCYERIL